MQIVLATSPHVRHPAVLQSDFTPDPSTMYTFAPVGLLALAAVLRQDLRTDPVLFDVNAAIISGAIPLDASFYRTAAERICAHEPAVLGFMTECDSYHHVLQILEQVKLRRPACRCVLGGPHASAVARPTLARHAFVDAIVVGEGERSLPDLIRRFADGDDTAPPGVVRRGGTSAAARRQKAAGSEVQDGGPRPLATSLDDFPIPAYDLYPGTSEEEVFVEVGRGCPFQCTFCSTAPYWQRRHRVKSPARILAEIGLVQRLFRSKRVHFTHDLLTTDKHWVADLCHALIAAGVPVKWTCSARTDTVDRPLLELMASAGCNAIYFGIESGSPRVLRDIQKNVPIAQSLDVLRLCRDVGIKPNAGFIVGFPTEDRESVADTFAAYEQALELGTRPTHIFGFCPFAASSLYPHLDDLACEGHFVDIAIEPGLDARNRELIASDRELFGSYFRPRVDVSPTRLNGADEFSCLVEPLAIPVLKLSKIAGGMLEVFDRWTAWIAQHNEQAGASPHRRFYGSPLSFCTFVVEQLRALVPADDPILQLAEVMHTSLDVARQWSSLPPMTMATHRSVDMPTVTEPLKLSDAVRLKTVVATMRVDYDLTPLLEASPEQAFESERKPAYLLWDLSDSRRIRLSQVDPFLFAAVEHLQEGPQPVARLIVDWAKEAEEALDYDRLMLTLTEARTLRIVETL
jgi:tRNA A37 methylthiotransferase MiaB